jgi:DNA-binding transcriptional LysR family regulator
MWPAADLREIRVFIVLAEELHFGRTGERLGLTPSRVSQMIRMLEARLGGSLFDRTSRRVRLTPLGERLRDQITPAYEQLERAFHETRNAATGIAGTLRIGMYSPFVGGDHWPRIIDTFAARHPDCELDFIDIGLTGNYLESLRAGDADLVVLRLPMTEPDVSIGPILSHEPRVLLVSEHDPLADRQSISYEEIANRLVSDAPALPREMLDAFIPPTTPSGKTLRRVVNDSFDETMMSVAAGKQVHPGVPSTLEQYRLPGVVAIPIHDLPPSETAVAWLTANHSPKIQAFACAAANVLALTKPHRLAANQPEKERRRRSS